MVRRIDFNLFAKPAAATNSSSIMPEQLTTVMSDSLKLADTINNIAPGCCAFWVSDGEWSMHQMLMAILDKTGPAEVYMSTYAMSETPARIIAQLVDEKVITYLYCVLDNRVDVRTAGSLQIIKAMATKYAMVDTHAKVTVIINGQWKIAVVGSANYTENKRYESGVVVCDDAIADQQIKWIKKALADGRA